MLLVVFICRLQNQALLLLLLAGQKSGAGSVLKHLPDALVRLCGALEVLLRTNLLANILGLCSVSMSLAQ